LKHFAVIFLVFSLAALRLYAQSDSTDFNYLAKNSLKNQLITSFNKQINTYNLNSLLRFNTSFSNIDLNAFENYNSTFINTGDKSIRDEQNFSLSAAYKINSMFKVGFSGTSSILSDNRKIELNQASEYDATLFFLINPADNIYIAPYGGYTNNRQIGENDYGILYGAEGQLSGLSLEDLTVTSSLKLENEEIDPRKNSVRFLKGTAKNLFSNDVDNTVNFIYSENRKDYYEADADIAAFFNVKNNIESRTETIYYVQDSLNVKNFFNLFSQGFVGGITWRNIDRNTRYRSVEIQSTSVFDPQIDELRFEFESNTSYSSRVLNAFLKVQYSERDEKHIAKRFEGANEIFYEQRSATESSKNNNSARYSVTLSGNVNFSKSDKLSFSLFQNKLRYDTPSNLNYDDRDELLSIVRLRYSKMLTPFFEAFVNVEGTYNHTVYIFSERSSNNNVNRILSLAAGSNYSGKNVTTSNTFTVSANYTVYDFEDLNPNYQSFSFRQMTASDTTEIKLNRVFSIAFYGYTKFSEQGDFKWKTFSTKPNRFLQEIYTEPRLVYRLNLLSLSAGLRIFSLNSYNFKGKEKILDSEYLSTGPIAEALVSIKDSLYLRFYGWYEFIKVTNAANKELMNFNFQMNWNF